MKAHFVKMARYNAWANARIYDAARNLPDESYRRDVGAFFGSLHGTLNHLLVTDRIWMRRLTGLGDHSDRLDAIMFEDLQSLELARAKEDQRIKQYIDGLQGEDIVKEVEYATTKGVSHRNVLGDILAHLFNHQTHHRGQAHTILSLLGVREPQPLDLMAMLRESKRSDTPISRA